MTLIEKKHELYEYIIYEHLPQLEKFSKEAEEMTMYHEAVSELWKQAVRSASSLSAQIVRMDNDKKSFDSRAEVLNKWDR